MDSNIKYGIQMNNHYSNTYKGIQDLFKSGDLLDATIISGCKNSIKVHKIVLALNSEYFKNLLRNTTKSVTILFQIKFPVIQAIVDFMYYGKIMISSNYINEFISAVEILKIPNLSPLSQNIDQFGNFVPIPNPIIINNCYIEDIKPNKYQLDTKQRDKKFEMNLNEIKKIDKHENAYNSQLWNTQLIKKTRKSLRVQKQSSLDTIMKLKKMKSLSQNSPLTMAIESILENNSNYSDTSTNNEVINDDMITIETDFKMH